MSSFVTGVVGSTGVTVSTKQRVRRQQGEMAIGARAATVWFLFLIALRVHGQDAPVLSTGAPGISPPRFGDVSVHDPSVIKEGRTYWVFGTHLSAAKSEDLMQWTLVSAGVRNQNPLIPEVGQELAETFAWSTRRDLWAPCVTKLEDGRFYMYYCSCQGNSPLSALGLAVSDKVAGPYQNLKILVRSGKGTSEDGTPYNVDVHPNAIDPHTFFDAATNLWMVYGSYSGGIFMLKMDRKTGRPHPHQGYGKKLMGGRCPVEGAYIQYSPQTRRYYLFCSFGELTSEGGYHVRVARSTAPDGPFVDPRGNDMIECVGTGVRNPAAIEPYGAKLMGNFRFLDEKGNPTGIGYVSPGHNSTYYDQETGKYLLFFHTRFPGWGEGFRLRVHQMFLNEDGWFVVAPHRYAGETVGPCEAESLCGAYAWVNHGRDISGTVKDSVLVTLHLDGKITGAVGGRWEKNGEHGIRLAVDGTTYRGVVLRQWDDGLKRTVMALSAISSKGTSVWASQLSSISQTRP